MDDVHVRGGLSSHRDPIGGERCDDGHYLRWNCSLTTGTVKQTTNYGNKILVLTYFNLFFNI